MTQVVLAVLGLILWAAWIVLALFWGPKIKGMLTGVEISLPAPTELFLNFADPKIAVAAAGIAGILFLMAVRSAGRFIARFLFWSAIIWWAASAGAVYLPLKTIKKNIPARIF